jgi:hypothetical protein
MIGGGAKLRPEFLPLALARPLLRRADSRITFFIEVVHVDG